MASATAIAKPEATPHGQARRRRLSRTLPGSRLGRLIVLLNLLGLAILIGGALAMNELSRGLVDAKIDSLKTQGAFIGNVLEQAATRGEPWPELDPDSARDTLQLFAIPAMQRARIFDAKGTLIADSYVIADRVEQQGLPPVRRRGGLALPWPHLDAAARAQVLADARQDLAAEVAKAGRGDEVAGLRRDENGDRVVSVSIPIRHVQAVLGVLTLDSSNVDQIIAAQRRALLPFILIAIAVSLISSFGLTALIAFPVRRLARAADSVRLARTRAISLPDLSARRDELGDLARSLETMTSALSERMDAIERFAADVAHEIRNPLTSIRSAVETLTLVTDPAAKARLAEILKHDVARLDRLITDISNASRVDAELSREAPKLLDIERLIHDVAAFYGQTSKPGEAEVRFLPSLALEPVMVLGREGPLGQVLRNLIDNARSFSRLGGDAAAEVRVALHRAGRQAVATVDDDGPGIPPDNLETVFERFYTSRPKGAAFGDHSGLGLSIARQIIEAHGGTLKAENRIGANDEILGARFIISLPEARP